MRLNFGDLHDKLAEMSTLDLAFAYADYLDYDLGQDGFFIQEMQNRGLTFSDLEQELINYYDNDAIIIRSSHAHTCTDRSTDPAGDRTGFDGINRLTRRRGQG